MSIRLIFFHYILILLAFFTFSIIDAGATGIDFKSIKIIECASDQLPTDCSQTIWIDSIDAIEKTIQFQLFDRTPTVTNDRDTNYLLSGVNIRLETFDAVPEPATMILLGSGMILLAGFGRRKFLKKNWHKAK